MKWYAVVVIPALALNCTQFTENVGITTTICWVLFPMDDKVVFCAIWFAVCMFVQSYSSALAFLESVHGILQAAPSYLTGEMDVGNGSETHRG